MCHTAPSGKRVCHHVTFFPQYLASARKGDLQKQSVQEMLTKKTNHLLDLLIMNNKSEQVLDFHILYYAVFADEQEKPLVSYFNDLGKQSHYVNSQNYGSIERSLNENSIMSIIHNRIDFKKINKGTGKISLFTSTIPDFIIYTIENKDSNGASWYEMCVCSKDIPRSLPLNILQDKQKPVDGYGKADEKAISSYIVDYETLYNNQIHRSQNNTVEINNELSDLVEIMNDNIGQVLLRDDRLDQLQQKTSKLSDKGHKFKRVTLKMERRETWRNKKWKIIATGTVFSLATISVSLYSIFN